MTTSRIIIEEEFNSIANVLIKFTEELKNIEAIERAASIMIKCIESGGKIICCGNGGSMSDAMHFAAELTGRYRGNRNPLPAIAISDPAHLSCVANDFGYDDVFARYIEAHGKEGDVLLALSTSGNSQNISAAIGQALEFKKMSVVFITGFSGGHIGKVLKEFDPKNTHTTIINIPHHGTADRIQEISIMVLHILVLLIEKSRV